MAQLLAKTDMLLNLLLYNEIADKCWHILLPKAHVTTFCVEYIIKFVIKERLKSVGGIFDQT